MPKQWDNVNGSHMRRGYDLSTMGSYIAYHYFVGTDGTIKQNRPETDRTKHTRNCYVNMNSIAIVLAGSFGEADTVNAAQMKSLKKLTAEIQKRYGIKPGYVIGHKEASPTACPGANVMKLIYAERQRLRGSIVPPVIPKWK